MTQAGVSSASERAAIRSGHPSARSQRRRRPTKLSLLMTLFFVQSISASVSGLDTEHQAYPNMDSIPSDSDSDQRSLLPRVHMGAAKRHKRDTWRPDTELPGAKFVLGDGKTQGSKVLGYQGEWPIWDSFRKSQLGLGSLGDANLEPPTDEGDELGSQDTTTTGMAVEEASSSSSSSSFTHSSTSTSLASMSTTWRSVAASSTTVATPASPSSGSAAAAQETASSSSSSAPQAPLSFVCYPISECTPCPQSVMQYPYCRPYNNRRRVSCQPLSTSQSTPSANNQNHSTDAASAPILGWEACGKSPQKEARDYFEFIVFVAFLAISSTLYFVKRQRYLFQLQNLQFHQRISSSSSRNIRTRGAGNNRSGAAGANGVFERAKRKRLARVLS